MNADGSGKRCLSGFNRPGTPEYQDIPGGIGLGDFDVGPDGKTIIAKMRRGYGQEMTVLIVSDLNHAQGTLLNMNAKTFKKTQIMVCTIYCGCCPRIIFHIQMALNLEFPSIYLQRNKMSYFQGKLDYGTASDLIYQGVRQSIGMAPKSVKVANASFIPAGRVTFLFSI
jgi:hypothetical protein